MPSLNSEPAQYTEEVLLELGRDWDDIAVLKTAGVILWSAFKSRHRQPVTHHAEPARLRRPRHVET